MVDGFLGRWSQRKQAARAGRPVEQADAEPTPPLPATPEPAAPAALVASRTVVESDPEAPKPEAPPPPSMQNVAALHTGSDFTPFMTRAVAPEVRNAAMKKLFSDPHFNVMDGLDTYIDDYSLADPLPASMLRKMASAKFMNLFEDDAEADGAVSAIGPGGAVSSANSANSANSVNLAVSAAQGDANPVAPTQDLAQSNPPAGDGQPPDKPEPDGTDNRT